MSSYFYQCHPLLQLEELRHNASTNHHGWCSTVVMVVPPMQSISGSGNLSPFWESCWLRYILPSCLKSSSIAASAESFTSWSQESRKTHPTWTCSKNVLRHPLHWQHDCSTTDGIHQKDCIQSIEIEIYQKWSNLIKKSIYINILELYQLYSTFLIF